MDSTLRAEAAAAEVSNACVCGQVRAAVSKTNPLLVWASMRFRRLLRSGLLDRSCPLRCDVKLVLGIRVITVRALGVVRAFIAIGVSQ
jgi:hypothetical protein